MSEMLTKTQCDEIRTLAQTTLSECVKGIFTFKESSDSSLNKKQGVFVTLEKNGSLRGCIGQIIGKAPLYQAIQEMTYSAAFKDPRFPPVSEEELSSINLKLSILSPLEQEDDYSKIVIGQDGLVLQLGQESGVFLPEVPVSQGWGLTAYLEQLSLKAGLPINSYQHSSAQLYKFTSQVI